MTIPTTTEPVQRTITIPDACKILGISATTGYALAARKEFPVRVLRLGRKMLVSRTEMDSYLEGESKSA